MSVDQLERANQRITELESIIVSLREKEADWHLFSLATSNLLWNWNFADGSVERNHRFETTFGYSSDEIGPTISWWIDRLHPDDRERVLAIFQHTLDNNGNRCSYAYRFRRRDGSFAHIDDDVFILRDADGKAIRALGAMTDVSERVRLMERARQLANLEALGTLAAGIAHDFNNRLQSIVAASELLRLRLTADEQALALAQLLEDHARGLGPLVSQLMTFAKGGEPVRAVVDICKFVRANVNLALAGSSLELRFTAPKRPLFADVDETQLGQVVHNLVINAIQATPGSGRLDVGLRLVDADLVPEAGLEAGSWIELSVRDHGTGIPLEQQERIFELFYTTKASGTGLGLATVWSIVSRHGGVVRVESQPGEGACFSVYLRPTCARPSASVDTVEVTTGTGRILVMDDQAIVRESLQLTLGQFGYEVVAVEDGTAAITTYARALDDGRPFAAAIVDLTIPGKLGGVGTKDALRKLDPGARVIVASGYSDDPVLANMHDFGFDGALRKPFDATTLVSLVGRVISTPGRG